MCAALCGWAVCIQVTQDDIDREFMPRRGRRKFTKEDAIYGLWADHDSDDERGGCVSGMREEGV